MKKGRKKREYEEGLSERLKELLNKAKSASELKRIQCVYFKVTFNLSYDEIAKMVGYSNGHVRKIQIDFWKNGEEIFPSKEVGGRIRENMTIQEEAELIDQFKEKAEKGNIVEISVIHQEYEKKLKKNVSKSTIYRMLARHGWRKIAPRPHHPKNNKQKMENFKKNRLSSYYQESQRAGS